MRSPAPSRCPRALPGQATLPDSSILLTECILWAHSAVMHCLVTGATGYIGGRLAPRLLDAGYTVRCLSRSAARLRDAPWADRVEIAEGDLTDPESLRAAVRGVEVAYFLVHSLGRRDFEELDRAAAH